MKKVFLILIFIICTLLQVYSQKKDKRELDFQYSYYYLEGERQRALENYNMALSFYLEAKKIYPKEPAPNYVIALLLLSSNDPFAANEYAKKAVKLDKTQNEFYIKTLISCQLLSNDIDNAIKSYQKLIKINPKNIVYYTDLTAIYESKKDYKNAIKTLDEAERVFGINESFSMAKESYYSYLKDKKKALEEIEKLLATDPQNNRYKAIAGESYLIAGDTIAAEKIYEEIENTGDIDGKICLSIANFYQSKNNPTKYFQFLEQAFADDAVDENMKQTILFNCIDNLEFSRRYKNELKRLVDIARTEYPNSISFIAIAIDYYINVADYKNAQNEMEILLTKDKDKYQVWEQILMVDYSLNDTEKLYQHSKEATILFPNYLEFYKYFVTASYLTKNYKELIEAVNYSSMLALTEKETLVDLLSMQAEAYNELEEHHKSDSVYELILSKDPNNLNALNNYSYYLSLREEKLDRALELSEKLIGLQKDQPIYFDTYAWVLFKSKNYDDALFMIDRAISLDPNQSIYYNHKGDILFRLNKIDDAVNMWIKARELGDNSELLNNKINSKKLTN